MVIKFVGREKELRWLEEEYVRKGASLTVVYGRRRVGKTRLVSRFMEGKDGLYFFAEELPPEEQLRRFSSAISRWAGVGVSFTSWEDAFRFLVKSWKGKAGKLVVAIDEFPYLVASSPSILSTFQRIWDEVLSHEDIMLILIGSSVAMMENYLLSARSPLYGRRTAQIEVKPFTLKEVTLFYGSSLEEVLLKYGVSDGIPAYAEKILYSPFPECLEEVLHPNKFLYNEALFLLKEEFRETAIYKEILYAIAHGRHRLGEIAQWVGVEPHKLSPYLRNLITARIVERTFPVTERKAFRGAHYVLADNYLSFWFRFIFPHRDALERGLAEAVKAHILEDYSLYMGGVFEKSLLTVAEELVPFPFTRVGKWWKGDMEIDMVALNERDCRIFFGEVKWGKSVDGPSVERSLRKKAEKVDWCRGKREEHFAVFARNFRRKPKEAKAYTLKELEMLLTRPSS